MDIIKVCGVIVLSFSLILLLKIRESKLSSLVSVITVLVLCVYILSALKPLIESIKGISLYAEGAERIIAVLLKAGGIGIITQLVSMMCAESGEKNLSIILDFAADVAVVLLALPFFEDTVEAVMGLLDNVKGM